MSLGRAWVHKLVPKLDQAQKYGLTGLELFYEDLEYYAKEECGGTDTESLLQASKEIRKLCDQRGITIIGLQPFWQYEGLKDRKEHKLRIEKLKVWFKLAKELGTNVIQIPTNFLKPDEITSDRCTLVADLTEAADLGAKESPPINFAFESLAWATYIDTWDQCWELVEAVNRPNFGACLDTFNIAGRVYADPASPCGKTPNADADIAASCKRLASTVDVKKVFYIQVVDAERLASPLVEGHEWYDAEQPCRMSWSRNCRLFYGEEDRGGYLPIKQVCKAFLEDLKFDGWVSMELFNRSMNSPDPTVPEEHARRAAEAWEKLKRDFTFESAA